MIPAAPADPQARLLQIAQARRAVMQEGRSLALAPAEWHERAWIERSWRRSVSYTHLTLPTNREV